MNILMLAPYVTINGRAEFSKNKTGFGYMVYDIARAVAQTERVDVLASDSRGNGFEMDRVSFIKRSFGLFFLNVFRCLSPLVIWRLWSRYKMSFSSLLRLVYYWLISGYYYAVISKGNYNIVHIHGCGFATELWMRVCSKCNQKFVVTLHGLNSFSDTVRSEPAAKQYERDFLKRVVDGEITITVISTGIKRVIENTYGVLECDNISVVCNSYSFLNDKKETISVRENYGIPTNAKILLYVGNFSKNKNQLQMAEAFCLLPIEIRLNTWVLFCGKASANGEIEKAIGLLPDANHFILCGAIPKDNMPSVYKEADGVALLSVSEGFGLSLIEGMQHGLPCAMPTDLDAFDDIYDPVSVVPIKDRNNTTVAEAIEVLLLKKWDKEAIVKYSKKFSSETMVIGYKNVYINTK